MRRACLLIALLGAACRTPPLAEGMADSSFVATMGDLRHLEDSAGAGNVTEAMRAAVLKRHRVTAAQLDHAAQTLSGNPVRAADLWKKIEHRADSLTKRVQ